MGFLGFQAFARFEQSRYNYDEVVFWLGGALACLAVVAWDGRRPQPRTWPSRLAAFLRQHRIELLLLMAIVALAAFMRLVRFGDFPPSGFICCEEAINGGVAYRVLHGERPLGFPLVRYPTALGLLLFGESATGMRLPFVILGILTIIPFYLLLRELVSAPAALFATALLATARALVSTATHAQPGILASILLAYLLVRGARTGNPYAWLGAGLLSGLISYEYETFKAVPILAVGATMAGLAAGLVWPAPASWRAAAERVGAAIRRGWKPALVFLAAAGIALVPMLVAERQGDDVYFSSLNRQRADRERFGTPGLFASNWEEQLQWSAEVFLPFGPQTFPKKAPFDVSTRLVDPVTGTLLGLGVLAALLTLFRPYRLLFLGWYLGILGGGALLLSNFASWKFTGVLPAGLVLVGFLAEEARRLVSGPGGRRAPAAVLGVLLVGGVSFAAWWNGDTIVNSVAKSDFALREYGNLPGRMYAFCDYLRGRGRESFSYTMSNWLPEWGFAKPHDTFDEQRGSWGDFIFVCHDLEGQALPSAQEAWPLRNVPDGPVTIAFLKGLDELDAVQRGMARTYPSKSEPDTVVEGPEKTFAIVGYEFAPGELKERQGLLGTYLTEESAVALRRVDDVTTFSWASPTLPEPPFTVQWTGLVYVPWESVRALRANTTDGDVTITIDGRPSFSSVGGEAQELARPLLAGWHPVEVTLAKKERGGSLSLVWADEAGRLSHIERQDLFALPSQDGWIHLRTIEYEDGQRVTRQRLDLEPHYSSDAVLKLETEQALRASPAEVVGESWSGVWHVPAPGEYQVIIEAVSGVATLVIDGEEVARVDAGREGLKSTQVIVLLSPGAHPIELRQVHGGGPWTGARLRVVGGSEEIIEMGPDVSPY